MNLLQNNNNVFKSQLFALQPAHIVIEQYVDLISLKISLARSHKAL